MKLGLYAHLEARAGKEQEVEKFLQSALPMVEEEQGTAAWFAIKMGPTTFGIFDVFHDEEGRQAHLSGKVAAALMNKAPELFAKNPSVDKNEILAAKLPAGESRKASA